MEVELKTLPYHPHTPNFVTLKHSNFLSLQSDSVSARDLVSAVSSAKEDALVRLVRSGSVAQGEDLDLDTDINTTYLYRRLNPKVAVTQGEKVILLAADQLAKALQDTTESKDDVGKNEPSEDSDNSVENDSTQDQQQR